MMLKKIKLKVIIIIISIGHIILGLTGDAVSKYTI